MVTTLNFLPSPTIPGTASNLDEIPAYLLGADNHNMGNTGKSWFDPETWTDAVGNGFKMIASAVVSGATQLYNGGIGIGNVLGANAEEADIENVITSLDSDLGAYYAQNKQGADIGGFILSSFVPGLAGTKILNAGQVALKAAADTGRIGSNLSKATGLLVPRTENFINLAANELKASQATFNAINTNTIKALASGAHAQALEAAAFEVMVQATMSNSPVLKDQSVGDIINNIALGSALGAGIGGALVGIGTYSKIGKLAAKFELDNKANSARAAFYETNDPALKAILGSADAERKALPTVIDESTLSSSPELRAQQIAQQEANVATQFKDAIVRTQNDIRLNINSMAPADSQVHTNMLADMLHGTSSQNYLNTLLHAKEVTRAGVETAQDRAIAALRRANKDADVSPFQRNYVILHGEGAGNVIAPAKIVDGVEKASPILVNFADRVKPINGSIKEAVLAKAREFGFKPSKLWDASTLTGLRAHEEAEARYIWISSSKLPKEGDWFVHQYDIPSLEHAYETGRLDIRTVDNKGYYVRDGFSSRDELLAEIKRAKDTVSASLLKKRLAEEDVEMNTARIAKITNTKISYLEGTAVKDISEDLFAHQSATRQYKKMLESKGLPAKEDFDSRFAPKYARVNTVVPPEFLQKGHTLDGMTYLKRKEQLAKEAVDNVLANNVPLQLLNMFPDLPDELMLRANRKGAGAGMFTSAAGDYGSLEAAVNAIGVGTQKLQQFFRKSTEDTFAGPISQFAKNQAAVIEYSTFNQIATRSGKLWVRHTSDEGVEYMVTQDVRKLIEKGEADFDELLPNVHYFEFTNPETVSVIDASISRTGARTTAHQERNAAMGYQDEKDPTVFRPTRPDPKDYKHFAFVKDPKVTGQGHTTMIFANDAETLAKLRNRVEQEGYSVYYKEHTEDFYKAYGDYEYSRTLNESYIDANLKNKGIFSEHFTRTDPQSVVDSIIGQHLREDDVLAKELVRAKYNKQFSYLEDQGRAYTQVESSTLGGKTVAALEKVGVNPYLDYIKTALNISKAPEATLIYGFNKGLDDLVSRAVGAVKSTFDKAKSVEELELVNKELQHHGIDTAFRDSALEALVNHSAPKAELTKFVRGANAILARFTLGLDPLNALNNAIGSNVTRIPEITYIQRAIRDNSEAVGELAKLSKVVLPGTEDYITSPGKMINRAIKAFFQEPKDGTVFSRFKEQGYIKDQTQIFKDMLDDFTLQGNETAAQLTKLKEEGFKKAKELIEKGEKLTGNTFAEEFNRFISAHVMSQFTDLAERYGVLTRAESHAYINNFVNRVEGVTIASQRPLIFQGPVGQAIGLFQSYQFNLMQQLFRYVAEGKKKDIAMMMGLQGTFYGANGLPGFQSINNHIVGTMSGNKNHTDMYDATYGIAGKEVGNFILYGLPSNLLQTSIYSRGDLTPRNPTILPTSLNEVPAFSAYAKFFGGMKQMLSRMTGGGPVWENFLQGVEHNGISRPLAGLAQTMQAFGEGGKVYSTTSKGSIIFSNDLFSLATLSRVAGARPLEEAIVNDGVFRIHSYQLADRAANDKLASVVKSSMIQGNVPDEDQIVRFAEAYAKNGGKQVNFNKYMINEMKAANTNGAQKILSQLNTPFANKMQILMGGEME